MVRLVLPLKLLLLGLTALAACAPQWRAPHPAIGEWRPGRFVQESFLVPDFDPEQWSYLIAPFAVERAVGTPADTFQDLFQAEVLQAWQAQGLKVEPGKNPVRLSGTIHHLSLRGARLRWLTGRLFASLTISGTLSQGDRVFFAFRDQVAVSSPLAPGKAAPRERELLLARLAREAVQHILNELLLHRRPPQSG